MANTSIAVAVSHAVSFLTRRLVTSYPASTIGKLQLVLEANLTALYAPTWTPQEPLRGSGRRCMSLSPNCLPPRAIYQACLASGVQWFDWIAHLGGQEFDFFVDPGCVAMRTNGNQIITIWADEIPSAAPLRSHFDASSILAATKRRADEKTFAQHLLELDTAEDDQLFSMISNEVNGPAMWVPPARSTSPLSTISSSSSISTHSRSSSRNSNHSFGSLESSSTSEKKSSRRSKKANVFVDTNKKEVTPYDGGKTTVLTGGVMLGGSPSGRSKKSSSNNWRA